MQRVHVLALATSIVCMSAAPATAQQRTWNFLTTGNGYGFQVFDTNANKITPVPRASLSLPRGPARRDPHAEGVVRRNLAFDFYFGVRGGGTLGLAQRADRRPAIPATSTSRTSSTRRRRSAAITAESYFFAPFDFPGNAMVALLKAPGASDGFVLFNFHMGTATKPDAPGADGESVRATSRRPRPSSRPARAAASMVYVPLSGVDHSDCSGRLRQGDGGHGSRRQNTSCSGNDVVPALPEEARRRRLDGRRRRLRRQHQPRRRRRRRGRDERRGPTTAPPDQLLADARAEFEAWRKPPPATVPLCSDAETQAVAPGRGGACAWGRFASRTRRRARTTA